MPSDSIEPFSSNWTYLKAELAWLDRILSLAIARQRKEAKEVDRLARSQGDRVTSHWWKGLVNLESEIAYDSPAEMPRRKPATAISFQQQMEAKIQASQQQGISLGLPMLCARLQLMQFEKNLVLMALAPEISCRYGRIYSYLQDSNQSGHGLPTVDLILRTFCRNDSEWRSSRQCLTTNSLLIQHRLLEMECSQAEPLLTRSVKLCDLFVNFLLADRPDAAILENLLHPSAGSVGFPAASDTATKPVQPLQQATYLRSWTPEISAASKSSSHKVWSSLILPEPLLTTLQHLCHRVQFAEQVDAVWGFQPSMNYVSTGSIALLTGAAGTGKTTAAWTIAQTLQTPLLWADLALFNPAIYPQLMQEILEHAPTVLLLKSAHHWFGRSANLSESDIYQLLAARRQHLTITLLSVQQKQAIKPHWQQMSQILEFPRPNQPNRLLLWQQAFPAPVPLHPDIDWNWLAQQFVLTGGEIRTIAREAAFYAAAEAPNAMLTMEHLLQACKIWKAKRLRKGARNEE